MALGSSDVAARLSQKYKGIEGFYILNAAGGLGYFSADGDRLVKETFADGNAGPADNVDLFLSELHAASDSFPLGVDKEIGYLMPLDGSTLWNTATLVLHEHIAKDLKDAFERDLVKGRMTLDEGDRKFNEITTERGLHRGFEDLLNHIGAFNTQTFFPVLYYLSAAERETVQQEQPMRVLNLLSLITGAGRFTGIVSRMRRSLSERGALNQASRVEYKFTLQE